MSRRALMRRCCSTRPAGTRRDQLVVPDNITIVPLPPKCPELNPQENVWQFIRDNWLSNRVFDNIRRDSSITAAMHGTSSRRGPGPSCPSDCAIGRIGSDQRDWYNPRCQNDLDVGESADPTRHIAEYEIILFDLVCQALDPLIFRTWQNWPLGPRANFPAAR